MKNKLDIIFVVLVLVAIFGGIGLFLAGMIFSVLWLSIFGFILAGVGGIGGTVLRVVLVIKGVPISQRLEFKRKLNQAKQQFKQLTLKQKINFILLTIAIVSSWICMFVFGKLDMTIPMFISLGVFVGIGVIGAAIAILKAMFKD